MSKVSIVVPVYNAGDKLHRCIQSILSQTFKDWTLSLIDDGSSDDSVLLCKQYEKLDDRIWLYEQTHAGSIAARRKGVELSRSLYVMFVDADDRIDSVMLERLVNVAEADDIDITVSNIVKVLGKSNLIKKVSRSAYFDCERLFVKEEIFSRLIPAFLHGHSFPAQLHGKLYKRELFQTSKDFLSKLHFFGDDLFYNLELFIKARTIKAIPDALYYYHAGGMTSQYMPHLFMDVVSGFQIQKEVVETYYSSDQAYHFFGSRLMLLNTLPACLKNLFLSNLSREQRLTTIAGYCSHPVVQECANYEPSASKCSTPFIRAIREMDVGYLYNLGWKYYMRSMPKRIFMNAITKLSF